MSQFEPGVRNVRTQRLLGTPAMTQLASSVLDRGADLRFQAGGFSMEPFIRDGDIISLRKIPARQLKIGDIVAFTREEGSILLIHRLLWKRNDRFKFKGDNNPFSDGWIKASYILAKIIRVQRDSRDIKPLGRIGRLIVVLCSWLHGKRKKSVFLYKFLLALGERY